MDLLRNNKFLAKTRKTIRMNLAKALPILIVVLTSCQHNKQCWATLLCHLA